MQERPFVGDIRDSKDEDFRPQLMNFSTTNDAGGRFYIEWENGKIIGFDLQPLMEFIMQCMRGE